MNTIRVAANSNKVTDRGAWVELFAQENGGAWLRVTTNGPSQSRSVSVIIPPDDVTALRDWLTAYTASVETPIDY